MKKPLLIILLTLSLSALTANAQTTFIPKALTAINAAQNGYTFGAWKTGLTCTIEDKGRMIVLRAAAGPVITMYVGASGAVGNYRGTWTASTYNDGTPPVVYNKNTFTDSTLTFNPISGTLNSGAYIFTVTTSAGTRNVALFPNGFYVSKNNSALYMPGC